MAKRNKILEVFILAAFFILSLSVVSGADEEAGNRVYVTAGKYGQFYAKSVPHETYGLKGTTRVYRVDKKQDVLVQTYDWYSPQVFIEGLTGSANIYVVQMGPWHRGDRARDEDHAIAFYKNDKLLKKYSTLDIAGSQENITRSVSHFTVFSALPGFRRVYGNKFLFDVETIKGKLLSFDADTGNLITREEETTGRQLYEAEVKIAELRWRWYESNKDKISRINSVLITEKTLKRFAPTDFPDLPQGYRYIPALMWKPIRIEKAL